MIDIKEKYMCDGCHACYSVCPKDAINMDIDDEGFVDKRRVGPEPGAALRAACARRAGGRTDYGGGAGRAQEPPPSRAAGGAARPRAGRINGKDERKFEDSGCRRRKAAGQGHEIQSGERGLRGDARL